MHRQASDFLWPDAIGRKIFDSLDSTNRWASDNLSSAPFWVLAYQQTAGVGRQARPWHGGVGNFAATYCAPIDTPLQTAPLHSFIAALALYDACLYLGCRAQDLSLKWPNDVLLKGGKLAGILLETALDGGAKPSHLLVGIGVNLVKAPITEIKDTGLNPRSLSEDAGLSVSADDFLCILANTYQGRKAQFKDSGFAPIRTDWLSVCAHKGQTITARRPNKTITGIFETLDEDGALILNDNGACHIIHAGDIFFPPQTKPKTKDMSCCSP